MASEPEAGRQRLARLTSQPENKFASLVTGQEIAVVPLFTLESGTEMRNVPVAYKTFGQLAPDGRNALVLCHALTGSADVSDWWGPLMGGPGKAFDLSRFFIVCLNSLGSPYGSASPTTARDGDPTAGTYGPDFPATTIRDDVSIFKIVLDDLGVKQIAAVVGGSMGGMLVLEFAFFGADYVRTIVPMATSGRYSAWGISWGETQRQSIYSDPRYRDGYYSVDEPPAVGLSAARMAAMLTYRTRDSFEARFGRKVAAGCRSPPSPVQDAFQAHNDGHRHASRAGSQSEVPAQPKTPQPESPCEVPKERPPTYFSAQSYLRYQGDKFVSRYDANCYIAGTRKLDSHDVGRGRGGDAATALGGLKQRTLVMGIKSDGLFTFDEQRELAAAIPGAQLKTIHSADGHDAFLLEFEQVNSYLLDFFHTELADLFAAETGVAVPEMVLGGSSTFGEAEDLTAW